MGERDIEQLAIKLREAAFPGVAGWSFAAQDTRERWIAAAHYADSRIILAENQVLREAAVKADELGQVH